MKTLLDWITAILAALLLWVGPNAYKVFNNRVQVRLFELRIQKPDSAADIELEYKIEIYLCSQEFLKSNSLKLLLPVLSYAGLNTFA